MTVWQTRSSSYGWGYLHGAWWNPGDECPTTHVADVVKGIISSSTNRVCKQGIALPLHGKKRRQRVKAVWWLPTSKLWLNLFLGCCTGMIRSGSNPRSDIRLTGRHDILFSWAGLTQIPPRYYSLMAAKKEKKGGGDVLRNWGTP